MHSVDKTIRSEQQVTYVCSGDFNTDKQRSVYEIRAYIT